MKNNNDANNDWYKDAIIYEAHVKSFYDSNADGIGDFQGLCEKLDYLQFLGINTLWILPFYPSPLKDDGYDIADYKNVNPIYGTLRDFKNLLQQAHAKGIRVMTELVLNHTSSDHIWFQKSRAAKPNSFWRNFYVWSDDPTKYKEARIIFKDFESSNWTWDPVAKAYYWHRFYHHQPDLNYDNPAVQETLLKIVDYWLALGVDGLRLDAIPYLYEREGTSCENLPETHAFLKKLRKHVDAKFKNKFLLAEANQWPDDAVAYFGQDDECHMAFHFPMMPRMYTAIQSEDSFPLVEILKQTPEIPPNCQWASFLRNHDELTLEMVTDEERDYMYRMYAHDPQMRINLGIRRRLAPLMNGDKRKIELMNLLLFTLPGTPILYYGDEIGMGDNIYLGDRNGVRTPMQWNGNRNAGFSAATPQKLFLPLIIDPDYNFESINVELQKDNDQSLLWIIRRLIELRKRFIALRRGDIKFIGNKNNKILAFTRTYQDETLLIVINLSRFPQFAQLDLTSYEGSTIKELFGDNEFPKIEKEHYFLSLNRYSYMCFMLQKEPKNNKVNIQNEFHVNKNWEEIFNKDNIKITETALKYFLPTCSWFASKNDKIYSINIMDKVFLNTPTNRSVILMLKVNFKEKSENYLTILTITDASKIDEKTPILLKIIDDNNRQVVLVDAMTIPEALSFFLTDKRKKIKGENSTLEVIPTKNYRKIVSQNINKSEILPINTEQSNSSTIMDNKIIFKFFRRIENGNNPEVEICNYLTEKNQFNNIPLLASTIVYQTDKNTVLGMMQQYIEHQSLAWDHTLENLKIYFEEALTKSITEDCDALPSEPYVTLQHYKEDKYGLLSNYSAIAKLLGTRTAELHIALSDRDANKDFKPEFFSTFDQRSLNQSVYNLYRKVLIQLSPISDDKLADQINKIKDYEDKILNFSKQFVKEKLDSYKIRCHGDYHLGQVLFTGSDVYIIDFEGEPDRSLSERRIKKSPLYDVAGMLRSFHYAVQMIYFDKLSQSNEQKDKLDYWANYWYRWVSYFFVTSYFEKIKNADLLPKDITSINSLIKMYMLEKAIYEIRYEINHRPDWLKIPLFGIDQLIEV